MNLGNLLTASALRNPHKAALITGVGRNLRDHRRIWVEKTKKHCAVCREAGRHAFGRQPLHYA